MKAASAAQHPENQWGTGEQSGAPLFLGAMFALACVVLGVAVAFGEFDAVILSAGLLASALILVDFRVGVVLLISLMPISGSHYFPHQMLGMTGLNPVNLLLMATFGSYLFSNLFRVRLSGFLPAPLLWLYIVPIAVAGMLGARHVNEIHPEMLEALNFFSATGYLRDMLIKPLLLILLGLLVGAAVVRSERPERFLVPLLISIWAFALLMLWFIATSGMSLSQMASSTEREFLAPLGQHANDIGRFFAFAYALLLFAWAAADRPVLKAFLGVTMALSLVALALTFSRGAFLGFIVISYLFMVSRRQLVLGLLGGAFLFALLLAALPPEFYARAEHGLASGNLSSVSADRIDRIWKPLIPDLLRSPIWGNGLSSVLWSDAMRSDSMPRVSHPHNAYLATLLDMGVVGLALLMAYFVHVWKGFRRLAEAPELGVVQRGLFAGARAGLVAFLVTALVDSQLTPVWEQVLLWIMIGTMYGFMARAGAQREGTRGEARSAVAVNA